MNTLMIRHLCGCLVTVAAFIVVSLLPTHAIAYVLLNTQPGGRLIMNLDMQPTTTISFIGGALTWNQVVENAMFDWNQAGIGPALDHSFFLKRSPAVVGDPCSADGVNEVRWASTNCGLAFGSAVAVTQTWSVGGTVIEKDMYFDVNRSWNFYTGPLRTALGGSTLYDLKRVALHEMGHAAGLDHPDDFGQNVASIMNARISNIDSLQSDDINGAHAIAWGVSSVVLPDLTITALSGPTLGVSGSRIAVSVSVQNAGSVSAGAFGVGIFLSTNSTISTFDTLLGTCEYVAGELGAGQTSVCSGLLTVPSTLAAGTYYLGALADHRSQVLESNENNNARTAASGLVTISSGSTGGTASSAKTLGSRATVSPTATLYGGFTLASTSSVYILARGNSLGSLAVTPNFLDSPRVRLYNSQNQDLLSDSLGVGFAGCTSNVSAAAPVVSYYTSVRGQPAHARDACTAQTLAAGTYTFTVVPSVSGAISAPATGEVLFEVTLGGGGGSILKTLGSRATASPTATLYGGFTLGSAASIYILVRGNSLGTLAVTPNFLDSPRVRLYNSQNQDLLSDSLGAGFAGCTSNVSSAAPVASYYTSVRGQSAHARDACTAQTLAAGTYTFTVRPSDSGAISSPATGEILFEVTLNP